MDEFYNLLKIKLPNNNINNIQIYCRLKRDESIQYWFKFIKENDEFVMFIQHFKNYFKEVEMSKVISNFGKNYHIFYKLITTELKNIVKSNSIIHFYIGIGFDNKLPKDLETIEYTLNTKLIGFNKEECPICKCSWILNNPIILDCKHKVCHKCFLGLVKNKNYKCPICRDILF